MVRTVIHLRVFQAAVWGLVSCWACTALLAQSSPPPQAAPPSIDLSDSQLVRQLLDPTHRLADVGDQPIFSGDLLPTINQMLQQYEGKMPEDELDMQRAMALQQLLTRKIETKLIYLDFLRSIPKDKREEATTNIAKQLDKQFYEQQVESMKKKLEVDSLDDLDKKLRTYGSSLAREKMDFRETAISQFKVSQTVEREPEITHEQLLDYYHQHSKDYDILARARWEKLTARFNRFPSKAAAEQAIVEMGNQVLLGAPFAAVAKRLSQGTNAQQGGYHDWTTRGCLVSTVLDDAVFSLPIHQLSRILEDDSGFHIVRVLERREAGRTSFTDAQDEIRKTLQGKKRKKQIRDYIEKLHKNTYVWNIFKDGADTAP